MSPDTKCPALTPHEHMCVYMNNSAYACVYALTHSDRLFWSRNMALWSLSLWVCVKALCAVQFQTLRGRKNNSDIFPFPPKHLLASKNIP